MSNPVEINSSSNFEVTYDNLEFIQRFQQNRTYTYTYQVDKPNTNNSLIDDRFKVFKLYNALRYIDDVLNKVEELTQQDLIDCGILIPQKDGSYTNNTSYTDFWNSDEDLYVNNQMRKGIRGFVGDNATGFFNGKDRMFAIYIGPDISSTILKSSTSFSVDCEIMSQLGL